MAPSLQVLIDFLLAEIALCGDQGASVADILSFAAAFYAKAGQNHAVDRRFQAKLWSWLTRHAEVSVGKDREANHLSFEEVEHDVRAPRVFVSEERTWLAITGHEPDETKVLPTEFALLSIIASGKSNGIPQTDLVRLSGQDKRSVPKRTDVLQKKGYIQKRAIQVKSTRTSLCTLCKFLQPEYVTEQASTEQSAGAGGGRMVDFKAFTDKLFDILRDYKIVARNDLKRLLGFSDAWHWKVLSRALRKFERIGVLKRVKAMSQYQDTVNKLHPCVMLLRDPSDRDLEMFHEFSQNLFSNLGNLGQKEDVDEPDEDYEEEPERTGTVGIVKREESVEEAGRVLPTWTPDRSLYHIILDKVDAAGTSGVNNHGIVRGCFGAFFRRPLENTMARLVECWQLSQPLHLRHLAIVRDTILQRTNAMYVHYSFRNYKALVDAGEVSWEAVEFVAKGGSKNRVPPVDAVPQLDEHGFPSPHSPDGLFKNGNASLLECMAVCKPADYTRSGSDPVAVRLKDGGYALRMGSYKLSSHDSPVQQSLGSPRSGRPKGRPKGTPNKPRTEGQDSADESEIIESSRPPKKSKRAEDRLTGLSQREKLEALGMDETWTEYSVLLLERENPGVYVTPRGRRRPVGKSRGRPRTSQLVVFKSPKLASLPWFVEEKEESEEVASTSPREQSMETPSVPLRSRRRATEGEEEPTPRGAKRSFQGRESDEEEPTPSARGKQARREDVPDTPATPGVDRAKRKRQPSMQEVVPAGDDDLQSKKRRQDVQDAHDTAENDHVPPTVLAEGTRANLDKGRGQTQPAPESTPDAHKQGKRGRTDRGGSVAVLRRKIIMDIVENAGGAFPMGTELWYPFTTTWMKTKFKEKPDMRTVRTSVKHLIDAGKLRQQTFSGRDSKGIMVTKSIVAKPEMASDDPVIKDLEAKMLAEGTRFYFPPNTEINPELTKSGAAVKREFKPVSQLPVETGVTVQLQQKPALVLAKERRVQRQLLERLESDEAFDDSQARVHRLMTIQRRATNNLTSIARPGRTGKTKQQLRTFIPSTAQYAMLMSPRQTFNPTNGTFGTDAGLAVRRIVPRGRPPMSGTAAERRMEGSPESLDALFARTGRHDLAQGMDHNQFLQDNDDILQWELDNQEAMSERNAGLRYINQTVPNVDTVPIEGTIRFDIDEPVVPTRGPSRKEPVATRRRARRSEAENVQAAPSQERRLEKLNEMMSSSTAQKSTTRQPLRRNRTVATLPQSFVQRVMTAIVAVRVLAGGAEGKMVDWPLVSKCFPDHDPRFLQDRARNLLNRNRLQIAKMQGDFQERYLEAYASGKVPSIDYNDLDSYDWGGLVDWAQTQLDVPTSSEKLPDLPATRAQFDSVFELREEAPTSVNIDEVYQNTHAVTFQRKRALFASTPFAEPVTRKPRPRKPYLDDLATAKTWVRANVITPEESYRAQEARQALSRFGDTLVTYAVHSLVTERVIKMGNRGRITPGRNYDITEPFISALRRRAIDSTQLRRAAEFKRDILDPRLRESGVYEVDYNAEDGDILALINLAANRRVTFKPRDPPRNQYGLTDGGYLTRQMDKRKLRFAVDVLASEPVCEPGPAPDPPSAGLPGPTGLAKIPLWVDIHGNHSALLWELVTAAVIGCVASRPGISPSGIAGMVRPAAAAWEIQLLLEWMEKAGYVQKRSGWVVREWWWMCLGLT